MPLSELGLCMHSSLDSDILRRQEWGSWTISVDATANDHQVDLPRGRMQLKTLLALLTCLIGFNGCSDTPVDAPAPVPSEWTGTEYGTAPAELDEWAPAGKEDGVGTPGPNVDWDTDDYQVWDIRNQWDDVTPEAGLAWGADSGLTWNEKYAAWLTSLPVIDQPDGSQRKTFDSQRPTAKFRSPSVGVRGKSPSFESGVCQLVWPALLPPSI